MTVSENHTPESKDDPPEKSLYASTDDAPPPDGGLRAWVHVVGVFLLNLNAWGVLNAFGAYQTFYESNTLFNKSSSDIAWIGSLECFVLFFTGFLAGPIFDRGYLRFLLCSGTFLIVFGHMVLSLCNCYWQVILAQGITIGIGTGCLFVPCVAILPQYFSTRLGLATGLAISGSSIGGIVYPIVLRRLIYNDNIGFAWAVRILGFIALGSLIVPIAILRQRRKPVKPRSLVDWSAFLDLSYMSLVLCSLVAYMGLFVALFYLSYFAASSGLTNESMAFYIVPLFNGGSCFGRTIPNAFSDKTGPFNMIIPGSLLSGLLIFCVLAVKSEAGLIVLVVITGFVSGVLISILPLCFVAVTKDKSQLGTRIGTGFALIGFGILAGGPGGGRILGQRMPLNWDDLWIFGGASCCAAGVGYLAIRGSTYGCKLNKA